MSMQYFFSLLLSVLFFSTLRPWPCIAEEQCHPNDKQALLKIKETLNNNESSSFTSWNNNTDCCTWESIFCHPDTNRVVLLGIVRDPSLRGQIPAAIGELRYLMVLFLHNLPNLSGPIPSSFTNLTRLTHLKISRLNLSGTTIPDFLSQLKKLTILDLTFNNLTGSIPQSIGSIPSLSLLNLDHNNLRGTIPSSLSNLKDNGLFLSLSNNRLSGTIPSSFKYIDFRAIDVSRNQLRGDISMLFGPDRKTEVMDLSWNWFEFNMSNLEVHQNLTSLDLSHNWVYGSIPKKMVDLELIKLDVSYNRLCGRIPVGGSLQKFHYSSYYGNKCLYGAPLSK